MSMEHEVKVPNMGESIVSGILARWAVANGASVTAGQPIFELETDKITSEGMAEYPGTIQLLVEEGAEVKIGQVVARITENADQAETGAPATEQPAAKGDKNQTALGQAPSVTRLAATSGVEPSTVSGTGKGGRVTKGDMLTAIAEKETSSANPAVAAKEQPAPEGFRPPAVTPMAQSTTAKASPSERVTRTRLTPMRKRIAERLVAAQHEAAILSTFNEVDLSEVMKLRKEVQDEFVAAHGIKLGFMSFFVKAVVRALKLVPALNARIEGDERIEHHFYDIGVAVGTEKGLIVPVLRDCDQMSLADIELALAGYAKKAREGRIAVDDLQGGVFTISNGGVYGSLLSTPILNPPQSGILGMHAIQERPVAREGQVVIRPMMYLALSYDHRIVDGKEAVTFLVEVKKGIEHPNRLFLGI
jgi:2-oxoglutarate dehydrogenase E2 component (dihydrolipoamide succinyltransferase)